MTPRIVLLSLVATGLVAVPALAAKPVKGGRYAGTTSQGRAVSGRVTSNGRSLQLSFRDVQKCSDGSTFRGVSRFIRQAPSIKADGTIAYFKRFPNAPADDGFPHGSRQLQRITGSFANGGRTASVRVAQTEIGKGAGGRTCKSVVTFTLHLKG